MKKNYSLYQLLRNLLKTNFILFLFLLLAAGSIKAQRQPGDTVVVQTFTFNDPSPIGWGAPYLGTFTFPDGSDTYEKVLMYQTLKCDPATNADSYPCGEWDYITYFAVTNRDGIYDSTFRSQPNYTINGATPNLLQYTSQPTYSTYQTEQQQIVHTNTISLNTASVGTGTQQNTNMLGAAAARRSQFIWRANELTNAGLVAGSITGLQLQVETPGSELRNLSIKMKHTFNTTLSPDDYEAADFIEVYHLNTTFATSGWQSLQFSTPFTWNGVSNIAVEFTYNNADTGLGNTLLTEETPFASGIESGQTEYCLDFKGADYIDIPVNAIGSLSNEVTISFWTYGNPDVQPKNNYNFEGVDANNNRVLNVHLPWSNGNIYWDAGNSGGSSYDRIEKAAAAPDYEGQWVHWAFTKNTGTGMMYIYKNGVLWHSGSAKYRTMEGITRFYIGIGANTTNPGDYYNGRMKEFAIFNKALPKATIAAWMNKTIDNTHPDYANLIGYYPMNQSGGTTLTDATANANHGNMNGYPQWKKINPSDNVWNLNATNLRPNAVFEQGEYESVINTLISEETEENDMSYIVLYENPGANGIIMDNAPNHPSEATNSFYAWQANIYTYTWLNGVKVDSTLVLPEVTIVRNDHEYYSNTVTYEIGRYITPYGINLDLGPEGTRWIFDVTDYAPLLRGTVDLRAGNNQELLDLKFLFIKGTPQRNVLGLKQIYPDASYDYTAMQANTQLPATNITLPQNASMFRIKTRTSGHGFGATSENCAEFCPKFHKFKINGVQRFNWYLWNECSDNFVYPQGGTWIYDRGGWCPGAIVRTYDHELTPFVNPGESVSFDYDIQTSPTPYGNYVLAAHLISYGAPNFQLDASIEDIISPSVEDMHSRKNPICDNPRIKIRNTGADTLRSVLITYGVRSWNDIAQAFPCYYRWEGQLTFLQEAEITLPLFNWTNLNPDNPVFYVELSEPNYVIGGDQYLNNNKMETPFTLPPQYQSGLSLYFRTNSAAFENSYTVTDDQGNVVYTRTGMTNNTTYDDVFDLPDGCYTLRFNDTGQDGISWWANSDGTGWVRLKNPAGGYYLTFEPDYGMNIVHQFTIGYNLGMEYNAIECENTTGIHQPAAGNQFNPIVNVFPNPSTDGKVFIDLSFDKITPVEIQVFNALGQMVAYGQNNVQTEVLDITLPPVAGIYYVQVLAENKTYTARVGVVK